ncbi:nucleotidyltransferase domain-containing protein [soil metagenome]
MLCEAFAEVIDATVVACREIYGERLRAVVVFGSVARQRMRPDSDLDLLVVAEPLPRGRLARMDEFDDVEARLAPALTEAQQQGVRTRISAIVRTLAELDQGGFLIFDIACDGRVCFDADGALTDYLTGVRQRLERRGAKRQTASGDRYWVLDPDVRPGDVVVL